MCVLGAMLPLAALAQGSPSTGLSGDLQGMQGVLDTVRSTMMVHAGELAGVGRAIAGLGALFYCCYKVWGHLARNEGIDFYPLLRPFALSIVLVCYTGFVGLIEGIMEPTVAGTAALVTDANAAITTLLAQKQQILQTTAEWQMYVGPTGSGDESKWEAYNSGDVDDGVFSSISNGLRFQLSRLSYNFRNGVKLVLSQVLEVIYEAAALCINTLRTFELVLLAILGPLAIGISAYPGFHGTLGAWVGRYVNVFLWLPVVNICGSLCGQVEIEMIKIDIAQLQASGTTAFGATDVGYLIFLVIGIFCYFSVPSITNHILNVFPYGGGSLLSRVSGGGGDVARTAGKVTAMAAGGVTGA